MTYLIAALAYLALVGIGIRFFQHVHRWDEEIRRLSRQERTRKTERQKVLAGGGTLPHKRVPRSTVANHEPHNV